MNESIYYYYYYSLFIFKSCTQQEEKKVKEKQNTITKNKGQITFIVENNNVRQKNFNLRNKWNVHKF